jgi:hypothetical protein
MTFWIWTFFKINKCPKSNSLKKCFLGALKNLEGKKVIIMRTENAANIRIFKMDQKIILGIFGHFFGHFWTFLQKLPN